MDLDATLMDTPPEIGTRWRSDYITGIGRRGDAFVVVFALARLFAGDDAALIDAGKPAPAVAAE
jgi:purine-binding chemotaxis protein CheW